MDCSLHNSMQSALEALRQHELNTSSKFASFYREAGFHDQGKSVLFCMRELRRH